MIHQKEILRGVEVRLEKMIYYDSQPVIILDILIAKKLHIAIELLYIW